MSQNAEKAKNKPMPIVGFTPGFSQIATIQNGVPKLRIKRDSFSRTSLISGISAMSANRNKEYDEDYSFFKMTLLAEQLNHKDFIAVKNILPDDLFYEAKFEQSLGFQHYAGFIREQLDKYYLIKTKNADPERFMGKEAELDDFEGVTLYIDME